jgi:ribosome-binding factor A
VRQFKRAERIQAQMLRDVRTLLDQECAGKLGVMVTFTDVKVSLDLRYATIFYSVLGDEKKKKEVFNYLRGIRQRARLQIGRQLRIRHIPEIRFEFDPSIERGIRIEELLKGIYDNGKHRDERLQKDG